MNIHESITAQTVPQMDLFVFMLYFSFEKFTTNITAKRFFVN